MGGRGNLESKIFDAMKPNATQPAPVNSSPPAKKSEKGKGKFTEKDVAMADVD